MKLRQWKGGTLRFHVPGLRVSAVFPESNRQIIIKACKCSLHFRPCNATRNEGILRKQPQIQCHAPRWWLQRCSWWWRDSSVASIRETRTRWVNGMVPRLGSLVVIHHKVDFGRVMTACSNSKWQQQNTHLHVCPGDLSSESRRTDRETSQEMGPTCSLPRTFSCPVLFALFPVSCGECASTSFTN